jgi:PKD repeat protein
VAIRGLSAANSGATRLASATSFTATILDGSNVSYVWEFGDGTSGSGANASRTYGAVGSYTAVVTATNGVSEVVASTQVSVIDRAITGPAVTNSGPTPLGSATAFNVYHCRWQQRELCSGTSATAARAAVRAPSRTYAAVGVYTAVVTATNGVGQAVASTQVTVDQSISGLQGASAEWTRACCIGQCCCLYCDY